MEQIYRSLRDVGLEQPERLLVLTVLMGLPKSFDTKQWIQEAKEFFGRPKDPQAHFGEQIGAVVRIQFLEVVKNDSEKNVGMVSARNMYTIQLKGD